MKHLLALHNGPNHRDLPFVIKIEIQIQTLEYIGSSMLLRESCHFFHFGYFLSSYNTRQLQ